MFQVTTILWHYLQTKYCRSFRTREELIRWQNQKVETFLSNILSLSPFYQEFYKNLPIQNWRDFPTIDKQMMMEHFDQLNTVGIQKEEAFELALQAEEKRDVKPMMDHITISLSSGTSGHRGLFLESNRERLRWTGVLLAKLFHRSLLQKHRIALFLRTDRNRSIHFLSGRIQFRFFDLTDPIEDHYESLVKYQPTVLMAPPSVLRFLAEEKKFGKLSIQPEKIISLAEVLEPLDQRVIEDTFNQTIHQIYQCAEGILATTCEYGTLHINEDILVIQKEYIDKDTGKFSPIITDFNRTTQPIIRYQLDDILVEKKDACPCGSPMMAIQSIEGRCEDIFAFPAIHQRKYIMVYPDLIRKAVISAHPAIQEYLVIQHSTSQLEISLRAPDGMADETSRAVVQSIRKLCQKVQCRVPDVLFTPYYYQPTSQKLRRIQRSFPLPTQYSEVTYDHILQ